MKTSKKTLKKLTSAIKLVRIHQYEWTPKQRLQLLVRVGKGYQEHSIERGLLADLQGFRREMAGIGASIHMDFQAEIDALNHPPADTPTITVVRRALWDAGRFVSRFGELGGETSDVESQAFDQESSAFRRRIAAGDLDGFIEAAKEPVASSPTLLIAFLLALVPALKLRLGKKGGSYCVALTGDSTTGKTLATKFAHSVSSRAEDEDLQSWNMTSGRAGQLGGYSGTLLAMGDPKSSREKDKGFAQKVQTVVFGIVDGSKRDSLANTREIAPEACICLMSFEKPVVTFLKRSGMSVENGDRVRILDIPVPTAHEGGIFELAPERAVELAEQLSDLLNDAHGVVLPRWIDRLGQFSPDDLAKRLKRYTSDFGVLRGQVSPFEARYTEVLRSAYVAGRLAIKSLQLKIVDQEMLDSHFGIVTKRVLTALRKGDVDLQADVQNVRRALIDASDFPVVELDRKVNAKDCRQGFRRIEQGRMLIFVRSSYLDRLVKLGNRDRVLRDFEDCNALLVKKGESTWVVAQRGLKRRRYLKFDRNELERMDSRM